MSFVYVYIRLCGLCVGFLIDPSRTFFYAGFSKWDNWNPSKEQLPPSLSQPFITVVNNSTLDKMFRVWAHNLLESSASD